MIKLVIQNLSPSRGQLPLKHANAILWFLMQFHRKERKLFIFPLTSSSNSLNFQTLGPRVCIYLYKKVRIPQTSLPALKSQKQVYKNTFIAPIYQLNNIYPRKKSMTLNPLEDKIEKTLGEI